MIDHRAALARAGGGGLDLARRQHARGDHARLVLGVAHARSRTLRDSSRRIDRIARHVARRPWVAGDRRTRAGSALGLASAPASRRSASVAHPRCVRSASHPAPRHPGRRRMTTAHVISGCAIPGTPLAHERAGLDACVHCGFCLQACPTYLTLEDENDSPRGRIVLMRSLLEGTLNTENDSVQTHIAQCLGCRACETACPSGVPYGQLLEATRATLADHSPIPFVARVILGM